MYRIVLNCESELNPYFVGMVRTAIELWLGMDCDAFFQVNIPSKQSSSHSLMPMHCGEIRVNTSEVLTPTVPYAGWALFKCNAYG